MASSLKTRSAPPAAEAAPAPPIERPMARPPAAAATPGERAAPAQIQNRAGEKRVRRGRLDIGATLDLHGHTQQTARTALARFLTAAHARGFRTVIVITGVGRDGRGVLKQRLPEWLAEPELRKLASGFAEAHRTHGGAGAFYVFLRARRRSW